MVLTQLSMEVQTLLGQARTKAVELHHDQISSEVLLNAIISDETNSGVALLKAVNVNLGKLRQLLKDKFDQTRHTYQYNNQTPALSYHCRQAIDHAERQGTPVTAAGLLQGIYAVADCIGSHMLKEAGYYEAGERPKPSAGSRSDKKTPNLNSFSTDLTREATEGKLDPVIGRADEINRLIEILARKKKNNPVLIGEPGVGKSAIVDGLAQAIINDTVPDILKGMRVVSLNLNALVSGSMYRGQFEERLQKVLKELRENKDSIIVFIDEMHTMMGNGGTEGTGDTAQIIKPALSRGDIRCIGATTISEYRKHIEKDGALERRFQKIVVEPPTAAQTRELLTQVKTVYEVFHGVNYTTTALDQIVQLTARYVSDRNFPDKALDVLDESGAIVKLNKQADVTETDVQKVVSKSTGIPVTSLSVTERQKLKTIDQDLNKVVVDQTEAITALAHAIKRARTNIKSEERPSSFIFLGPTGVGKTELAKQLAKYLFGKEDSLLRFDMSEYAEHFNISKLIGSPPGYVGYNESGKLTEAVKRKPYSVVLLDEVEKAHPDVFNIFLQALDDGIITDASGRKIDFRNTIMIFTSNIGSASIGKRTLGFSEKDKASDQKTLITKSLKDYFRPEFLNRLDDIIVFQPLTKESIKKITRIYIDKMQSRMKITFTPAAENYVAEKGYSEEYGARPLRRLLEKEVETQIADLLLDNENAKSFNVDLVNDKLSVAIQ